jgi:hypothetical protein
MDEMEAVARAMCRISQGNRPVTTTNDLLTACQDALAWIVQHKEVCADLEGCVSLVVTLQGAIARACQLADAARGPGQRDPITPSARQYTKWKRREGSAWKFAEQARQEAST